VNKVRNNGEKTTMSDDLGRDGVRGREPGENPNALQLFYIFLFPLKIEKYVSRVAQIWLIYNPYESLIRVTTPVVLSM
jgi:hypothetical protein